jgi:hypothetical protein
MLLPQAFVYKHCHDAAYDVLPRCESPRASLPAINLGGASSGWDPVSGWVVEEICQGIHDNKTFDGNGHAPCIALDRDDRADAFAQDGGSQPLAGARQYCPREPPGLADPVNHLVRKSREAVIYDVSRKISTNRIPLVTAGSN